MWIPPLICSYGAVKTDCDIQVDREWKLSAINPHDRHTWRSGVRSAMRAASKLPGRGPTDVDVAPVRAC